MRFERHIAAATGEWRVERRALATADAALIAAWDQLAQAASTPNIFYEAWMAHASSALPEAGEPSLLLVWHATADGSRRLDGVLPVSLRKARGIGIALENWDQRIRALGEPLVRAGHEAAFWAAILDHLDRARGVGRYLRLSSLIADSPSTRALESVLTGAGRGHYVTRRHARAVLRGGTTSDAYVAANIRAKVLKEHRRLRNRLADRGELRFERLALGADANSWIDDLFALEASGWKGREGVAAAADPATEQAFRTLLNEAHARGRLDFHRMTVAGAPLSMLANIEAGDHAWQLKIAYDEAHAAFSPGVLIEMEYLRHALDERGLAQVDSCARAGHPMIDRIWIERLPIVSLAIPYRGWSSRLVCAAADALRRRRARAEPTES